MDLAARTLQLCEIKSPVGDEGSIAAYVQDAVRGERIGNAVVAGRVNPAKPAVILAGHLDTVPLQEGDFPARRESGRIYGRGASDMKGALAVMIELWDRLDREELPVELVEVFYDREEGPVAENGLLPLLEKRPDLRKARLALCLEPTDLALQLGCCGSMHATLTFRGKSAHSARPWQGENAIHRCGALLTHLKDLPRKEIRIGELTFYEVMSVTRIEGFTGRNVVPAKAELNVNYRFAPDRSLQSAEEEIEKLARTFGAECRVTDRAPSGPVIVDNPLLQEFRALTAAPLEAKQAWTDVAQLAAHGIPAANFGPGEQAQAHQRNESCGEEALENAYRQLERFLKEAAT
ncbi:MAG: succinyl-diaminopimelate desuccinylase [Myxococcales bacterium]|nr:succinyl-diaminopimelate desuccinylase [Myxococcales bacterium]